ncbi:MAG TPA: class I SAM-dependent methyltransferase [Myxococcales bacterium]|nr:class I SAM-dependent methyltransferase [Myxococcales bacterium]
MPRPPAWVPPDGELRRFFGNSARYPYYRLRLFEYVARLLPPAGPCSIVDVGAGDGSLAAAFARYRPQTRVVGLEVKVRAVTRSGFQMLRFDGRRIPLRDASADVALLSNVLHHAEDPGQLLQEVRRVTRRRVVIKDHLTRGKLDDLQLRLLDVLGNLRLGAQVRATYLDSARWDALLGSLGGVAVARYPNLSFRRGILERVFSNGLELMFAVDVATA